MGGARGTRIPFIEALNTKGTTHVTGGRLWAQGVVQGTPRVIFKT